MSGGASLYWYWPFGRAEESGLATAAVRPADRLVIHTIDRPGGPSVPADVPITVRADLPEVSARHEGGLRWAASRARTYAARSRRRAEAVRELAPDVVHVMFVNRFTDAIALPRLRRRAALVVSAHDLVPHHRRLAPAAEASLLGRSYRAADLVVAHHERVAEGLVRELGVDRQRIRLVPLPVPATAAVGGGAGAGGGGGASGAPAPATVGRPARLLVFGSLRRNKGIADALAAMALLGDRRDVRLVVAGRGPRELERMVREAARRDDRIVAELGWVPAPRKSELYEEASLVLLPYTRFESQSAVLLDAYAHGVPVVVSDVGTLGADVRADGSGIVVPPRDPAALAAAIERAVDDPAWLAAARAAARRQAAARAPRAIGPALRAVYDEALTHRAGC